MARSEGPTSLTRERVPGRGSLALPRDSFASSRGPRFGRQTETPAGDGVSCVFGASSVCWFTLPETNAMTNEPAPAPNFIRKIIADDLASGRFDGRVVTRFPPEPNGYLHIGHAKSICLNFGLAAQHSAASATCASTTPIPTKEEVEYVESIMADVRWLGLRLGAASLLRVRLLRAALRSGRCS